MFSRLIKAIRQRYDYDTSTIRVRYECDTSATTADNGQHKALSTGCGVRPASQTFENPPSSTLLVKLQIASPAGIEDLTGVYHLLTLLTSEESVWRGGSFRPLHAGHCMHFNSCISPNGFHADRHSQFEEKHIRKPHIQFNSIQFKSQFNDIGSQKLKLKLKMKIENG